MDHKKNALLVRHFKKRIHHLLEANPGYARFRSTCPEKHIRNTLTKATTSRRDIIDLGFLIHLSTLYFRLSLYRQLTEFTMLDFHNDLAELVNVLHVYERRKTHPVEAEPESFHGSTHAPLIPPFIEKQHIPVHAYPDNPALYDEILTLLGSPSRACTPTIPEDLLREMQRIDINRINTGLLHGIKEKGICTVRNLANEFPVYKNEKRAVAAVLSEVLFHASTGILGMRQLKNDIGVYMYR